MDFELEYTKEQEEFRNEVRDWLADNMPEGLYRPIVPEDMDEAMYQRQRELGRRLAAPDVPQGVRRGWYGP